MKIVGKLVKKTVELGKKKNLRKSFTFEDQKEVLWNLLEKCRRTNFGKYHSFGEVLKSEQFIDVFQKHVPIVDYDQFYKNWLHRTIDGVKDHTWPGQIKYFALSSGTTGSPSKRIPVSPEMIYSFQKTSINQITTLVDLDLPDSFFQKSILTVGGSTQLMKIENHIEGDLSGILKKHTNWIASPFTRPGGKISRIKDWNKKMEIMVEEAPKWDIGILAGVPSWCIMLIEKIVERYQLNSIHDIWPNFRVYVHGGVFIQPYLKRLERTVSQKVYLLNTYLASEGYIAYQTEETKEGMQMLLNNGIFYEFIPFTEEFFNHDGSLKDNHRAYTLEEVETGIDYALVLSTNAGLWRYLIGDLIQFTNVECKEIKISGRIKQYLSLVGEHLSLDNINEAIMSVSNDMNIEIQEYGIYADPEEQHHVWSFGIDQECDKQEVIARIDKKLAELNDDYASVRKYNLGAPVIDVYPTSYFYDYMQAIGKLGSQNKFPRVMNQHQHNQWKLYLCERGLQTTGSTM